MSSIFPLLWVVGSALVYWLTGYLFGGFAFYGVLIEIVMVAILFGFGLSLSQHKRNNRTWVRKLVIAFIVLLVLCTRINIISASGFYDLLANLRITDYFIDLLLVYCGWSFFY